MDTAVAAFLEGMKEPMVPYVPFEVYSEQFKDAFILTRKNGICEIRMHTKGGPAVFGASKHHGWSQILKLVGDDPENEVVIITGTGDEFVAAIPDGLVELMSKASGHETSPSEFALSQYSLHIEGIELIRAVVDCINVPTIGAINGPAGAMSALGLLCDMTICSDKATFAEGHFAQGLVPADGTWQAYRGLAGIKRASFMAYNDQIIDAKTALEWGLVNEVVPHEDLNKRAWELAETLMKNDRYNRRATHKVFSRYYHDMVDQLTLEFGYECMANFMSKGNKTKAE